MKKIDDLEINTKNQRMNMKIKLTFALLILLTFGASAWSQTPDFTYQGRLLDSSAAANGNYDLEFKLYDAQSNGTLLGTCTRPGTPVSSGIFTVRLDFPANAFDGTDRFLEIGVKPASDPGPFVPLTPRQPITSAPYSVRSLTAATADLATNSSQLGGIPSNGFIHNGTTQQGGSDFNISGNGTLGGTLNADNVNSATQYSIAGNLVLSVPGQNTFVGLHAGASNTTATGNTFVGNQSGQFNTIGAANSFFGQSAGRANLVGHDNTFVGNLAGAANVGASYNSFFGSGAGQSNLDGPFNSFFGDQAGGSNSTGANNTFFGFTAGSGNSTGNDNVMIGAGTGNSNTTENRNTFIGTRSDGAAGISNATAVGNSAKVTQSNSLILGSINGVNFATADTKVGIGTTAPKAPLHVAANGTNTMIGSATGCGSGLAGISFAASFNCLNLSLAGNGTDTIINRAAGGSIYFSQNNTADAGISPAGDLSVNNKVGIGTIAPNAPLHIAGNGTNVLAGSVTAGCAPGYAGIGFGTSLNCQNVSLVGNGADTTINRPTGGSIYFMQNAVPEAGISPSGNLSVNNKIGIGTAAPNARLHIAANGGNVLAGAPIACSPGYAGIGFAISLTCNNYSLLGEGQNTLINRPTGGTITFRENNTPQMTINPGGTVSIHTIGSVGFLQLCLNIHDEIGSCASSLRYKTNVNPFTSGLNLVKQLKPITFDWKDGGMHDLGFGAEDVAAVEPLLVIHNKNGEVEGVKYDRISALLVNAVKEQQGQIEYLKRQLKRHQTLMDSFVKHTRSQKSVNKRRTR